MWHRPPKMFSRTKIYFANSKYVLAARRCFSVCKFALRVYIYRERDEDAKKYITDSGGQRRPRPYGREGTLAIVNNTAVITGKATLNGVLTRWGRIRCCRPFSFAIEDPSLQVKNPHPSCSCKTMKIK